MKQQHIESIHKLISRKVKDICFKDTTCGKPVSKTWMRTQMKILCKLFDKLEIICRENGEVRFYNWKSLEYFILD